MGDYDRLQARKAMRRPRTYDIRRKKYAAAVLVQFLKHFHYKVAKKGTKHFAKLHPRARFQVYTFGNKQLQGAPNVLVSDSYTLNTVPRKIRFLSGSFWQNVPQISVERRSRYAETYTEHCSAYCYDIRNRPMFHLKTIGFMGTMFHL